MQESKEISLEDFVQVTIKECEEKEKGLFLCGNTNVCTNGGYKK